MEDEPHFVAFSEYLNFNEFKNPLAQLKKQTQFIWGQKVIQYFDFLMKSWNSVKLKTVER